MKQSMSSPLSLAPSLVAETGFTVRGSLGDPSDPQLAFFFHDPCLLPVKRAKPRGGSVSTYEIENYESLRKRDGTSRSSDEPLNDSQT